MLAFTRYDNAVSTVVKLLKDLKINISADSVNEEMEKHPDYPSLLAVSDILTSFHIENNAYRLSYEEMIQVECPFIVNSNLNGGELLVVNKITGDDIYVSNQNWSMHKLKANDFKRKYAGVILTAEPSGESLTKTNLPTVISLIKVPALLIGAFVILAGLLFFHSSYFSTLNWQIALLTLFKGVGLVTSILLLIQSIDSNNPLVQKLCKSGGGKTDCNAILSSKAAKAFAGLTWSEIGFFYFAGTFLLLFLKGNSPYILQVIAVLNFVSLPYTVYSIYYQSQIAKQWCVLCCTIQALLWLEFGVLVTVANKFSYPEKFGEWITTLLFCLLAPVILWAVLKPLFLKLQELNPTKQQLRHLKYNTELFNSLLTSQQKYAQPDEEWSIVLGNVEANNIITMVTNPYCPPCAATHKLLDTLLRENADVKAHIIFTANNSETDIKTPVCRHLMALNEHPDRSIVRNALHDWYEQKQKNYEAWAETYPVDLKDSEFYKIDRQNNWCKMAEVTVTPTLLLNGHPLPEFYRLTDLKYMLQ